VHNFHAAFFHSIKNWKLNVDKQKINRQWNIHTHIYRYNLFNRIIKSLKRLNYIFTWKMPKTFVEKGGTN
jgi:hypothetical protein